MTELEEIGAQLKLFEGRTSYTVDEALVMTGLMVRAAFIRIEELERKVNWLQRRAVENGWASKLEDNAQNDTN